MNEFYEIEFPSNELSIKPASPIITNYCQANISAMTSLSLNITLVNIHLADRSVQTQMKHNDLL